MKKAAWIGAVLSLVLLLGSCTADNQNPTDTTNNTESVTNVTVGTETQLGTTPSETNSETKGETDSSSNANPEVESNEKSESADQTETKVETETTTNSESADKNEKETEAETEAKQYTRVSVGGSPNENGSYVLFGSWPQSEVTGASFVASLDELAGDLPTSEESGAWTSYAYYNAASNTTDFMWYQDVTRDGNTYRGVYFTSYRPKTTSHSSSESNSQQDEHGYTPGQIYWFKWEPLKWRILEEKNGNALLLCEMLIDAQAYQTCFNKNNGYLTDAAGEYVLDASGNKISANNYEYSTIRAWLADTFYATAFTDLQKDIIQLTTVDNSVSSTTDSTGTLSTADDYVCGNTQDHVFLLSESEVTREAYGFSSYDAHEPARLKKTTAYANCQGAQTKSLGVYSNTGWWWLRSPHYQSMGEYVCEVYNDGYTSGSNVVNYTIYGICPALWIKL